MADVITVLWTMVWSKCGWWHKM